MTDREAHLPYPAYLNDGQEPIMCRDEHQAMLILGLWRAAQRICGRSSPAWLEETALRFDSALLGCPTRRSASTTTDLVAAAALPASVRVPVQSLAPALDARPVQGDRPAPSPDRAAAG